MTNEHIDALLNLKRSYKQELANMQAFRNSDVNLTQEGKSAQAQQDQQRLAAKYSAELAALTARMEYSTSTATTTAAKVLAAVPAPADTRAEWERVTMLLDAGAGINTVVRNADAARLQAIKQYGPTYLEAEMLKSRPGGLAGVDQGADLHAFNTNLRNRWAEVLPDGSYVTAGAVAAGVAAEFTRSAQTFSNDLNGVRNGLDPVGESYAALAAGQLAAANFTGLDGA